MVNELNAKASMRDEKILPVIQEDMITGAFRFVYPCKEIVGLYWSVPPSWIAQQAQEEIATCDPDERLTKLEEVLVLSLATLGLADAWMANGWKGSVSGFSNFSIHLVWARTWKIPRKRLYVRSNCFRSYSARSIRGPSVGKTMVARSNFVSMIVLVTFLKVLAAAACRTATSVVVGRRKVTSRSPQVCREELRGDTEDGSSSRASVAQKQWSS